jgi:hypothetical protein
MVVTIAAVLCHLVPIPHSPGVEACHEEIVHVADSMQECILSQAAIADWKRRGRFADAEWTVTRIKCVPGTYEPKDAT